MTKYEKPTWHISRPGKLQIYHDGPAIMAELFPKYSTARIKFLHTNKKSSPSGKYQPS